MFAKVRNRHERSSSGGTRATPATATSSVAPPLVSPLQMTFDFELASTTSTVDSTPPSPWERPRTSDGLGAGGTRKSTVSLAPPVLPPIPRVASRHESLASSVSQESKQPEAGSVKARARDESDNISGKRLSTFSTSSRKSQLLSARLSFEHPIDLMPVSRPTTSDGYKLQQGTQLPNMSGGSTPKMESTLFPHKSDSPVLPLINTGPPMSRAFIDSRDKPYSHPGPRPAPVQQSHSMPYMASSPNLLSPPTPSSYGSYNSRGPVSPHIPSPTPASPLGMSLRAPKISGARLSPNSSVEDLRSDLNRRSTNATNFSANTVSSASFSGSTARPSTQSSSVKGLSPTTQPSLSPLSQTIGTPYQQTSSTFPLPQHVATRPKTAGATSTVAGVKVPTHHTSAARPESDSTNNTSTSAKTEKRKTRLLNPMSLLTRRKSGQEGEISLAERSAAAQAYARQRSVAAVGVNKLPEDFDPRIKGKVVHDFSAPRQARRNFSYNDAEPRPTDRQLQSANSAPFIPTLQPDLVQEQPSSHSKNTSESSSARRSAHSPMFREMLGEDPDTAKRVSSLNAERLENRDFLQRVSHHSSNSTFSQESSVLPPFARRSQQLDPSQAAFYNDSESKRSSDPSSGKERDSNLSSISEVSPITARSSAQVPELRDSMGASLSPVSPASPDKSGRPVSAISDVASRAPGVSPDARARSPSEATARPFSIILPQPAISTIAEDPLPSRKEPSPNRNSAQAPEAVFLPNRNSAMAPESVIIPDRLSSLAPNGGLDRLSFAIPGQTSSFPTPELTPEIGVAEPVAAKAPQSPPRLVEKRASAVGHSKRMSGTPKHRVSNASRFSFQFGESAEEEHALEEKHRKIKGQSQDLTSRQASPEDDEDEFDESAMDDMDEFEVQQQQQQETAQAPSTGISHLQQARQQLQTGDSDDGSVYDEEDDVLGEERELTYAEHPDFRAHSALANWRNESRQGMESRQGNWSSPLAQQVVPSEVSRHQRMTSDASALTLNTNVGGTGNAAFVQDVFSTHDSVPGGVGGARPRSGFYMQPQAAGYSPTESPKLEKPTLPHRDSGNSERNRVASGLSFGSNGEAAGANLERPLSNVTAVSGTSSRPGKVRVTSHSTLGGSSSSEARTNSSGLGLSGFSDFRFSDGSNMNLSGSRPMSLETEDQGNLNRRTKDSETIPRHAGWADLQQHASLGTPPSQPRTSNYFSSPESQSESAAYRGHIGKDIRVRNATTNQNHQYAQSDSGDETGDDFYFVDDRLEQDIRDSRPDHNGRVDEDALDNDGYQPQFNRLGGLVGHQRATSAMTGVSMGSDGPYPAFAMGANPAVALQRQSQLLLEDLPLQGPVDPKLIPQRNPSEDAKRLGLSKKVPPLPPQPGSREAMLQMQAKLEAYHAALADAANKAAAEGRFYRQPSNSTARSLSVYSKVVDDDHSQYSHDDNGGDHLAVPNGQGALNRSASQETSGSKMDQSNGYSPLKMNFDFGFDAQPVGDDTVDDDFGNDDDIVAAANAEALASDDEGFYGQEFGFYAKARPSSGEAQAINGGFFGEDGDDGLTRNKSIKEPNLTPITERSEFSTRNSFIHLGHGGMFGPASAGPHGPASPALARLPVSPLVEEEVSFDQLRKLRANAFGGSNGSLRSEGNGFKHPGVVAWQTATQSPTLSTRSSAAAQGYFGPMGGTPMSFGYSNDSNASSNRSSAHPAVQQYDSPQRNQFHDSPQSAVSGANFQFPAADLDATPRKGHQAAEPPATVRKATAPAHTNGQTHSRKASDSVTYVKEKDPNGSGQPRWVLERRRTSEQGQLELIGREVVQGGWI